MNKYESVIIVNPNVDEEGIKALEKKFTDIINNDGKLEKIDNLGKRKLAYEVKKVEKVSKTVKKNKKGEYIIEISSEPKNFFSKTTDELFEIVKKLSELYIEMKIMNI